MPLIPRLLSQDARPGMALPIAAAQSVAMTCAQIAIMPRNSASEAKRGGFFDNGADHESTPSNG